MLIIRIFVSFCFICIFAFSVNGINDNDISAKSAVVINRETKEIVFEKNAYEKRSMASTTKIMTAILGGGKPITYWPTCLRQLVLLNRVLSFG